MPVYTYTALDAAGVKQKGVLEAEHPSHLRRELRAKGLAPLKITTQHADWSALIQKVFGVKLWERQDTRSFSSRQLQIFTHQLALLLEGGMTLEKALSLLAKQEVDEDVKKTLLTVHGELREGVAFADCLGRFPRDFNVMYRTTVAAGERTGALGEVLDYLSNYIEMQVTTQQKIRISLFYPALLTGFALLVTIFLLTFIVPDLAKTFAHSGRSLPWLTSAVLALSELVKNYGLILLLIALVGFSVFKKSLRSDTFRHRWHERLINMPIIRRVIVDIELTAFVNTLAMLLQSGVTLTDSMRVSVDVVSNVALKRALERTRERVCEGTNLSDALAEIPQIPLPLIGLISGGEASGELTRILQLAAKQQSNDLQQRAAWFLNILEPCIILLTGLLVLVIVLAMMLPILNLNQLVY